MFVIMGKRSGSLLALAAFTGLSLPAAAQDIGIVCTDGPTFNLEATGDVINTPDGNTVFMWGLSEVGEPFQIPGPVLCVTEGDEVTINLTNNLPSPGAEPVSLVFPGQTEVTATGDIDGFLTMEADAGGGSASYTFTASAPGTYLYESGTQPHKQVHMGLYGVLVVRPALGPNYAYNDPTTEFAEEFVLVLHEIDPDLHAAVEDGNPFDQTVRHDRYWTINGRSNPDVVHDNFDPFFPSQPYSALVRVTAQDPGFPTPLPVLVHLVNAGTVNHPFHPHGNHMIVIAQDGRQFDSAAERRTFSNTIAAGQTLDMLFEWRNVENWQVCINAPCDSLSNPNTDIDEGAGPMPVEIPLLLNQVFKDGVTFYSGDPHLGFVDDLPVGVTYFGECGEFYFPWHSHALQTVQNFDEGFGGMLTLVRVDPPGGCH